MHYYFITNKIKKKDPNLQKYKTPVNCSIIIEIQLDITLSLIYNRSMDYSINLNLDDEKQLDHFANAINSPTRRKMLRLLGKNSYSIIELAEKMNIAASTISFHLKFLKEAGLVKIIANPNKKGNEKIVSQALAHVSIDLKTPLHYETAEFTYNIPIGSYTDFNIVAPCGLVNENGLVYMHDNPNVFCTPERLTASMLAFSKGYVEYSVPAFEYKDKIVESFTFSVELCSECPNYNNEWKSDITFWINGKEVCTYRSPGDYGDRRGRFPIPYWPANSTQYGMLKKIRIDHTGTFIDEKLASDITIDTLEIDKFDLTTLRIGIKENARYIGGVNLFGKNSGDTDQDIVVQVSYKINPS